MSALLLVFLLIVLVAVGVAIWKGLKYKKLQCSPSQKPNFFTSKCDPRPNCVGQHVNCSSWQQAQCTGNVLVCVSNPNCEGQNTTCPADYNTVCGTGDQLDCVWKCQGQTISCQPNETGTCDPSTSQLTCGSLCAGLSNPCQANENSTCTSTGTFDCQSKCDPGTVCQSNQNRICNNDGTVSCPSKCSGDPGCQANENAVCTDTGSYDCQSKCDPATTCPAGQPRTCNADGTVTCTLVCPGSPPTCSNDMGDISTGDPSAICVMVTGAATWVCPCEMANVPPPGAPGDCVPQDPETTPCDLCYTDGVNDYQRGPYWANNMRGRWYMKYNCPTQSWSVGNYIDGPGAGEMDPNTGNPIGMDGSWTQYPRWGPNPVPGCGDEVGFTCPYGPGNC